MAMSLTFDKLVELIETLPAESKAMLRILQRSNPMKLTELQTRSVFDVGLRDKKRENIIEDLIDQGLVEDYLNRFGVKLVRLTFDGGELMDIIDAYVFEGPDLAEAFKWM